MVLHHATTCTHAPSRRTALVSAGGALGTVALAGGIIAASALAANAGMLGGGGENPKALVKSGMDKFRQVGGRATKPLCAALNEPPSCAPRSIPAWTSTGTVPNIACTISALARRFSLCMSEHGCVHPVQKTHV